MLHITFIKVYPKTIKMLLFTCFILLTSTICCAATPKSEHAVTLDNLLIVQSVDVGGQAGSGCSWFDPLDLCDIGEKAVQKLLDALPGITNEIKDAVMEVVLINSLTKLVE